MFYSNFPLLLIQDIFFSAAVTQDMVLLFGEAHLKLRSCTKNKTKRLIDAVTSNNNYKFNLQFDSCFVFPLVSYNKGFSTKWDSILEKASSCNLLYSSFSHTILAIKHESVLEGSLPPSHFHILWPAL